MKQRKPMPDMYLPKAEREQKQEVTLVFSPCCECGKAIGEGYYGRWGNGGVCSKSCNEKYEAKEKDYGEPASTATVPCGPEGEGACPVPPCQGDEVASVA